MRWLLFLHRYIGIAVGWLMLAWCLSGVVMMYVAYPSLSTARYLRLLPTLDFSGCCSTSGVVLDDAALLSDFSIEMLLGEPTLRMVDDYGRRYAVGLATGKRLDSISRDESLAIASEHSGAAGSGRAPGYLDTIARDQWTIGVYRPGRLLHHIALDDPAGTEWYFGEDDGRLVQETTRRQRFWNWLGAVTHWIYPTVLRRHAAVWANVVIMSSIAGLFLTGFGIYIGIVRFGRGRDGRRSPYRAVKLWHHYAGLVFGVLTLTWVLSGLVSMNPWGLLESRGGGAEARALRRVPMTWRETRHWVEAIAARTWPADTVSIRAAPLLETPYLLAYRRDGRSERFDPRNMSAAPLAASALAAAGRALANGRPITTMQLIDTEDAFYYGHHEAPPLPVYRVVLGDADRTHYYLDADSGALVAKIDSSTRWYRWLFAAPHRLDFSAPLRRRPAWDVLMLVLLAGVTTVCFTGTYLAIRVLRRR